MTEKKRTILASEDPSKITPPSIGARARHFSSILRKHIRPRASGIGGTIGRIKRNGKPPIKIKWKVGSVGSSKSRHYGRLRSKSKTGFEFEVKF